MRSLLVLWAVVALSTVAFAASDLEEGVAAYDRQEYASALEILKPLAVNGNADAQFLLARMYAGGQGVAKDEQEAVKWVVISAGNGNIQAQETLASWAIREFMQHGQNVEDKQQKIEWIKSSAERGNSEAMNMLGMIYSSGNGVPMTTIEAEKWYCRAINQGHPTAARNLGLMMAGTIYYMERVKKVGEKLDPACSKVE
ncbi:MAG: sel1 repeat family protein [Desulfomonile tiedjei]|nr:sel1 repeat family protein [Desulfomonile tiedjei]